MIHLFNSPTAAGTRNKEKSIDGENATGEEMLMMITSTDHMLLSTRMSYHIYFSEGQFEKTLHWVTIWLSDNLTWFGDWIRYARRQLFSRCGWLSSIVNFMSEAPSRTLLLLFSSFIYIFSFLMTTTDYFFYYRDLRLFLCFQHFYIWLHCFSSISHILNFFFLDSKAFFSPLQHRGLRGCALINLDLRGCIEISWSVMS